MPAGVAGYFNRDLAAGAPNHLGKQLVGLCVTLHDDEPRRLALREPACKNVLGQVAVFGIAPDTKVMFTAVGKLP